VVTEEEVYKLVEEKLKETSHFIVDIKVLPTNKIVIEIDDDKGISIQDCVDVSKFVEQGLDREHEDFDLQVSSPGLSQPLKIYRQYVKNVGRNVEVTLKDGNKSEGKLLSVNEQVIILEVEEKIKDEKTKKKKTIKKAQTIGFENIKETKIVISFK
jgi:ribosome maturation factor RimP